MFIGEENRREWHVGVLRNLNDWEVNEYESLLSALNLVLLNEEYGQPVWTSSLLGLFMTF